jgi:hypothetical protein
MVAQTYNISREKQDHYAYLSHSRAEQVPEIATSILRAFSDIKFSPGPQGR